MRCIVNFSDEKRENKLVDVHDIVGRDSSWDPSRQSEPAYHKLKAVTKALP